MALSLLQCKMLMLEDLVVGTAEVQVIEEGAVQEGEVVEIQAEEILQALYLTQVAILTHGVIYSLMVP